MGQIEIQARSNDKITHFFIFYEVKTFGSVQVSVFFGRFQVRRFKVRFLGSGTNLGSEGSRFGFIEIRKVRGSDVRYFIFRFVPNLPKILGFLMEYGSHSIQLF